MSLFSHLRSATEDYIIVTALPSELPEAQPERILFTGVGKLNATYVLTRYLVNHPEIKTVINYGTAGGAHQVSKGELVKCTTFLQGDMDCGDMVDGPGFYKVFFVHSLILLIISQDIFHFANDVNF